MVKIGKTRPKIIGGVRKIGRQVAESPVMGGEGSSGNPIKLGERGIPSLSSIHTVREEKYWTFVKPIK